MGEPANGFDFLELLRQRNGNREPKYKDYSVYLDFKARQKKIPLYGSLS